MCPLHSPVKSGGPSSAGKGCDYNEDDPHSCLFKLRTNQFVKEVTPFLWNLVEDKPKLETCEMYAASLVLKYDAIAETDTDPYNVTDLLGELIYTYTKNNYIPRVVEDESRQRGSIQALMEQRDRRSLSSEEGSVGKPKKARKHVEDPKNFEEQQALFRSKAKDTMLFEAAIKSLSNFKDERRQKICTFVKILDVIKEWPVFKNPEVLSAEFFEQENLSLDILQQDFDLMVGVLAILFDSAANTELQKIILLKRAEDELSLPLGKSCLSAINLTEITNPLKLPKMPHRHHSDGPVAIVYTTKDEATNAFIHAENATIAVLDKPSAFGLYTLLTGTYYSFHRHYPGTCKNFFNFLELTVLHKVAPNTSSKFLAFKNRYMAASVDVPTEKKVNQKVAIGCPRSVTRLPPVGTQMGTHWLRRMSNHLGTRGWS
ncbi:Hypothetical predicted protein [Cloeon dipterum]|uniref:Uncharacterized protein n=1 Tax=Cloeon dipterum TaxID=197152 RepID=A0A8S1CX57_9INSE|nr:Hypothetical predicted protein [Cloeon dipterum]